jgi:hypothetical protein
MDIFEKTKSRVLTFLFSVGFNFLGYLYVFNRDFILKSASFH